MTRHSRKARRSWRSKLVTMTRCWWCLLRLTCTSLLRMLSSRITMTTARYQPSCGPLPLASYLAPRLSLMSRSQSFRIARPWHVLLSHLASLHTLWMLKGGKSNFR